MICLKRSCLELAEQLAVPATSPRVATQHRKRPVSEVGAHRQHLHTDQKLSNPSCPRPKSAA